MSFFKKKRNLIFAALGLIVVIGVALFLGQSAALKKLIEQGGSSLTGTAVTVDSTALALTAGTGSVTNLHVANPEGFSDDSAISIEKIDLKMQPMSLFSKKIVIEEMLIENPKIQYEVGLSGVNIRTIRKRISGEEDRGLLDFLKSKPELPDPETADTSSGREVQINRLVVRGGSIAVFSKLLQDGGASITVPDIEIENFTSGEGVKPRQVTKLVLMTLLDSALRAVVNSPEALEGGTTGILKAIGDTLKTDANFETEGGVKKAVGILNQFLNPDESE